MLLICLGQRGREREEKGLEQMMSVSQVLKSYAVEGNLSSGAAAAASAAALLRVGGAVLKERGQEILSHNVKGEVPTHQNVLLRQDLQRAALEAGEGLDRLGSGKGPGKGWGKTSLEQDFEFPAWRTSRSRRQPGS